MMSIFDKAVQMLTDAPLYNRAPYLPQRPPFGEQEQFYLHQIATLFELPSMSDEIMRKQKGCWSW